jgi:hypothetical protein
MWLKGKATQPPPPPTESQPATPARCDLATALDESSAFIASTGVFQVYRVAHWDGLEEEHPEEEWDELFPFSGALGVTLAKEFEARGGREFLGKAPFASWLLARLEYLGMGGVEEENDLGGYRAHFL